MRDCHRTRLSDSSLLFVRFEVSVYYYYYIFIISPCSQRVLKQKTVLDLYLLQTASVLVLVTDDTIPVLNSTVLIVVLAVSILAWSLIVQLGSCHRHLVLIYRCFYFFQIHYRL